MLIGIEAWNELARAVAECCGEHAELAACAAKCGLVADASAQVIATVGGPDFERERNEARELAVKLGRHLRARVADLPVAEYREDEHELALAADAWDKG